ncbi:hypothetical protein [Mesorhizobium retamae]|uniref:Uncharacterized protein n=1 Tax=Mesorhizobium retamae TaxID=2912854 RepID=A0ABS9QCV8_9HYPH|nr:hypothetical protein [Mesorhizobium sp. IRAMC:0171]MCG7505249.1 hypothetical protein [Mesorhizobium sp. IRAMC:0171]
MSPVTEPITPDVVGRRPHFVQFANRLGDTQKARVNVIGVFGASRADVNRRVFYAGHLNATRFPPLSVCVKQAIGVSPDFAARAIHVGFSQ